MPESSCTKPVKPILASEITCIPEYSKEDMLSLKRNICTMISRTCLPKWKCKINFLPMP